MPFPIARFIIAMLLAEIVPIFVLVAVVAIAGPPEIEAAKLFAVRAGRWVGPLAGGLCAFLATLWLGRSSRSRAIPLGCALGVALAGLDGLLIVAARAPFEWIFVVSNVGKIAAATLAGWLVPKAP